ncbi:MAG: methyltransferase domain-containing protein [Dehalococcoidia bacterium]
MSWTNFFQSLAELETDDVFVTGRPGGLTSALASGIAQDIATKLNLNSADSLLDYGSGTGNITRELCTRVAHTTAAESIPSVIKRGKNGGGRINWVQTGSGQTSFTNKFTKVLSYYNAHMFDNHTDLRGHIETLCRAVSPGGIVMLGDVPDLERTGQWKSGERGREENRTVWMGRLERRALDIERDEVNLEAFNQRLENLGIQPPGGFGKQHSGFDRDIVTRMFRENGGEVTVLAQPPEFPQAHTCVDYIAKVV